AGGSGLGGIARDAPQVVTRHVIARLRDERAAHRVAGGGVAGEKTERVAVDTAMTLAADAGTLGVADACIHREALRFAGARKLDGRFRAELPGVVEIEIGDLPRKRLGV